MSDGLLLSPKPWKITFEEGEFAITAGTRIQIGAGFSRATLNSAESLHQLRDIISGFFFSPTAQEASSLNREVATALELLN